MGPPAQPQVLSDSSWPRVRCDAGQKAAPVGPFDCGTGNETLQAPLGKRFATYGFFFPLQLLF